MPIAPGTRLGPYEITAWIGAGGMGEVYRGRDTRLRREVAVKVLPESFAADPDRVGRFEREAQVLASLSHPHIAAIYGVEDFVGRVAIVMEYVEGTTLADRIGAGPIPIDEALVTARQLAAGMDAAHTRGVIHRDLKPANIKVTPEGHTKILDFGLAKIVEPAGSSSAPALANSPTVTSPARLGGVGAAPTEAGIILGTAAYMAPEQARGRIADRHADVWAFGCVLFEMIAGAQAFGGDTVADVLGAILHKDPQWALLPAETPPAIRRLLRRCLQKPVEHRLHNLGDAVIEIDEALAAPAEENPAPPRRARWVQTLPWALAGILAAALALLLARDQVPPSAISKVTVIAPEPVLETGAQKTLVVQATHPSYVDGFLVFARAGTLFAVRFDQSRLETIGTPVPVLQGLLFNQTFATTRYAVSTDGRLAYAPGAAAAGRLLATIDRNSHVVMLSESRRPYFVPRVSVDGRRLVVTVLHEGTYSIWTMDLVRGSLSQLATEAVAAVWAPDGQRLAYSVSRGSGISIVVGGVDASAPAAVLIQDAAVKAPTSWSPDGRWIAFTRSAGSSPTGEDIYLIAPDGSGERALLQSAANESAGVFSPDGKWLRNRPRDVV